jgi:hypothetical protein
VDGSGLQKIEQDHYLGQIFSNKTGGHSSSLGQISMAIYIRHTCRIYPTGGRPERKGEISFYNTPSFMAIPSNDFWI